MTATAAGPAQAPVAGPDAAEAAGPYLGRCAFPAPAAGPVSLAVSGGADSAALMVLARAAGLEGTVIHVDHGLRADSGADAPVVERWASALGFSFASRRVHLAPGPDLEARARRARYSVLPAGVLTGHTMDDQAETVLLNLMRGAALDGLGGMRARPGDRSPGPPVRRPLLGLRRAATGDICRRWGIEPLLDPSNADARFRRNRVRAELVPLLCDIAGRDAVPVLARQAALLAADADFLEGLAAAVDPLDVRALRAVPVPLARRALRAWLRSPEAGAGAEAHPPSSADLSRVMEVVDGSRRACQISGGRRVSRRLGRLTVAVGQGSA